MSENKGKHVPMRTCIVTREKLPKNELVRFIYDSDQNELLLDIKGKISGRGANIKPELAIFDKGVENGAFNRALKTNISKEMFLNAREQLTNYLEREKFRKGREKVTVRIKGESVKLQ